MIKHVQLRGKGEVATSPLFCFPWEILGDSQPSSQKSKKTPPNFCKCLLCYYKFVYYCYFFNLSLDCDPASSSSSSSSSLSSSSSCSLLPELLYVTLSNGSCMRVSVPPSGPRTIKLMLNWTLLCPPRCHWSREFELKMSLVPFPGTCCLTLTSKASPHLQG